MALPDAPLTRNEIYLSNIAGQDTTLPEAPITREEMYLDYIAKNGGGGGGGGTTNYNDLSNKPQINGNALTGNKTAANLGLISAPASATAGQFLVYDGTAWVAQTVTNASGVSF